MNIAASPRMMASEMYAAVGMLILPVMGCCWRVERLLRCAVRVGRGRDRRWRGRSGNRCSRGGIGRGDHFVVPLRDDQVFHRRWYQVANRLTGANPVANERAGYAAHRAVDF